MQKGSEIMDDVLKMEIKKAPVSWRAKNLLVYDGLKIIADIYNYTEENLLRIPNFGQKSINEWNNFLQNNGLEKIKSTRQKYVAIQIPIETYEKVKEIAKLNERSTELEIISILSTSVQSIKTPKSLAARVDKIEALLENLLGNQNSKQDQGDA